MKYIDKIMKTIRNKIVPIEGSQISLQQTHSAALGLQVEGEKDEQRGIPGLSSELGVWDFFVWVSQFEMKEERGTSESTFSPLGNGWDLTQWRRRSEGQKMRGKVRV
ncbi:hypothetical protein SO802_014729 [Lithocarpus litseifolius]|uniref:Uncharacterized protein n=1 Tax=Lithocarpus litseifolius TaxID=425828 RepID=A0AAW2CRS9_9ROSI